MPAAGDVDETGGSAAGRRTAAAYIEQMQRIDGWLSSSDAAWFVQVDEVQKASGIDGDMVEIGVWHGRGAILFHHLLRESEQVFAVDIFDLRDSEHRFFNDPARLGENAEAFGCDDRLVPFRMDTMKDGHRFPDALQGRPVRLAHIDGGHDYEVVRRDIEIVWRSLGEGAVLVFDDFFSPAHAGTTQAILEFLQVTPRFVPFLVTSKKLWVCTRASYATYFKHLKTAKAVTRKTNLLGRRVLVATG